MMELRILELFSGIGGMHYAFKRSKLPGLVLAAVDINPVANAVYSHNHKETKILNNNIQNLNVKTLQKLNINTIVMSPPCQPHTRVGNKRDIEDNRSVALQHLCTILPECQHLKYILLENVKGFESSKAHKQFIEALRSASFYVREFILSPTQFDVPNTRHRYYCIARKDVNFNFENDKVWKVMPNETLSKKNHNSVPQIQQFLEADDSVAEEFYLPDKVLLKHVWLMEVVTPNATNSMCFTKAYTHYSEGTGSVFTHQPPAEIENIFEQLKNLEKNPNKNDDESLTEQRLQLLHQLRLRYFTPLEVARLMSFPNSFSFPTETTKRQKYRLLGNSINVAVVAELIKLMCQ